ncbi:Chromobox protein-like protein [Ooceraea biroi]|nr:Chromobox protein-like protein [Ooceraea biroi]
MKNKRRKSETTSDSEPEENGGARAATNNAANDGASQQSSKSASEDSAAPATRKSPSKRRSLRGAPVQKSAARAADDAEMKDDEMPPENERENGEKSAAGRKPSPNKRRRKADHKASTSANEKPGTENEYEVEELVGHRTIKGRRQFLVRWKGYGDSADSWENEKDLNCPELIKDFLAKDKETKSPKTKTRTDKTKKSKTIGKKQAENDAEDSKEGLKEFEVERIIEVHFKKNGMREFLIRWKGFTAADDTWEPEENLNCPELIAKFMQKLEKVKTADMRELRTNPAHTKRYTLSTRDHGRRLSKRNMDKQRATYHECDE